MNAIFEYADYRQYLRDFYEQAKKSRRAFNYRSFAVKAGLASPMHLRLVMTGDRNLTHKTLAKFARGLELGDREHEYFEQLVYFTQSRSSTEKLRYLAKLSKIKAGRSSTRISKQQQQSLFAKWYYVVLYELVLCPEFVEDPAWIAKRLGRAITLLQVRDGLRELEAAGLLSRDQSGRLRQNNSIVRTDDEVENLLIREYQRTMVVKASERIDDPLDQREFGFVTVCTTPEKFAKMKAQIKEFLSEANGTLTTEAPASGIVAQLNVQLFKLA